MLLFSPFILQNGVYFKLGKICSICINYQQFEKSQEVQARPCKVDKSYFGLTFAFFSELPPP